MDINITWATAAAIVAVLAILVEAYIRLTGGRAPVANPVVDKVDACEKCKKLENEVIRLRSDKEHLQEEFNRLRDKHDVDVEKVHERIDKTHDLIREIITEM